MAAAAADDDDDDDDERVQLRQYSAGLFPNPGRSHYARRRVHKEARNLATNFLQRQHSSSDEADDGCKKPDDRCCVGEEAIFYHLLYY